MNFSLPGRFVIPSVVATHFHFKPGDTVADIGAGGGVFLAPLAEIVTTQGTVIACEIQKGLVEKLGAQARALSLSNVKPVWCDIEKARGIPLPDASLDGAILVNTLFQLDNKAVAAAELRRLLRPGALLYVVDWTELFGGLGPTTSMVVTKADAIALFESAHFLLEHEYPAGDHHYGLAFRTV